MNTPDTPIRIFCSFAPEDTKLCSQLYNHLRPLEQVGMLTLWHQRLIVAGTDWTKAIDEHLASAHIILLLISPAFFASDYCYGVEMQRAMQRHEAGDARVIPILIRSVDWTSAPFAHLSPLPASRKPLAEQRHRATAFANVITDLRRVVNELVPTLINRPPLEIVSSVWNVPYRRNPHFTGREELFKLLDRHLSLVQNDPATLRHVALTQPQAIKGLGGIGKTQIAIEYAYRTHEQGHYFHTFWVNASSEEALITSFRAIAELLPVFPNRRETDQQKLVLAILHWLEQCKSRWLLIFDNADDVSVIQKYLPQRGIGSVLLTTRADAVGSFALPIEVETMGFIEGTYLLLRRAQRFADASDEEINEAGNVVIALAHFPLALDQAGAYIEETGCSFSTYLQLYQDHCKILLARRGTQATNYPDSVMTTWSLSLQKVEQANPAAVELLQLCSFLAPDRIPEELITDNTAYWPFLLQQATADPLSFNRMLEELLKFSLVKRLAKDNLLSIHRLVQVVQVESMKPEELRQWAERIVRATSTLFPPHPKEDITCWPQCLRYLEQVQACDTLIQQHSLTFPEAVDLLGRTGTYLREQASYTLAEPLFQHALVIQEQSRGPEHPDTVTPLNNLAILYLQQGKYEQAESLYQRALTIKEQHLGPEHPDIAAILNNLAILYSQQGKCEQAEPLCQRAVTLREQHLGPEHPDTTVSLSNLAIIYRQQGKYEQAESLCQRVLTLREQHLGPEHPDIAAILNNLAIIYKQQGKYEQAEPLYQRALIIKEQHLGPEHPSLATSIHNLASLYVKQGKYEQAEPLYQRTLTIRENILNPTHPDLSETLHEFAILQQIQGHYEQARSFYKRSLAARTKILGKAHPSTSDTRKRLIGLLHSMCWTEEALALEEEQEQCRRKSQTDADENHE